MLNSDKRQIKFRERTCRRRGTLDDLLPEAFAVVREASRRILLIPNA
jgi:preprotein translocase subunit SecA